jgi:NTP pyrophosphatase (non-canonical NTP hydrolase)
MSHESELIEQRGTMPLRIRLTARVGHTNFRPGVSVETVLAACHRAYQRWMCDDDTVSVPERIEFVQLCALNELVPQKGREFVPYNTYAALERELAEEQIAQVKYPNCSFQQRVWEWFKSCFGPAGLKDHAQRDFRFFEEATELIQARGNMSEDEAIAMVRSVYAKEPGKVHQEVGGVATTFAMLCNSADIDLDQAGDTELLRVWGKQDEIRAKQALKLHPGQIGVAEITSPAHLSTS